MVFSKELTTYCQGTAGYIPREAEWEEELEGREDDFLLSMLFADGPNDSVMLEQCYPGWEDDMRHYLFCEEMNDAALTLCEYILSKTGEPIPALRRLNDTQLAGEYVKTVQAMYALWDVDRPKGVRSCSMNA